ncbi:MAG: hypothetical protein ABEJ58_06905 [Halodesulfurarchaeum sp.]
MAGTAAVAAVAGCAGNQVPEANHKVPHPDSGAVDDAEANAKSLGGTTRPDTPQYEKRAVSFGHTPKSGKHCGNCVNYVPDQSGDGFGACVEVQGSIHPCDECGRWTEYTGEDAVPCEGN